MKGYCQNVASAWKKPGAKTTEVETRTATYMWFIVSYLNYGPRQINFAADYSQPVCMVAEVTSGKDHAQTMLISGRDSAYEAYSMHV